MSGPYPHKTNITLSSLEDLAGAAEEQFVDAAIGALNWRLHKARERLRAIKRERYDDEIFPPTIVPLGKVSLLDLAFSDGIKGEYPTVYRVVNEVPYEAESLDELLKAADELISEAEQWNPLPES